MSLYEEVLQAIDRIELTLTGSESWLREGEAALAGGDAWGALSAARRVAARLPASLPALALRAEAAQRVGLCDEARSALAALGARLPSRASIWLQLDEIDRRQGAPRASRRTTLTKALAVALPGSSERRRALLELARMAIEDGDGPRAELLLNETGLGAVRPSMGVLDAGAVARANAPTEDERADALQLRARVELCLGRPEAAVATFERAPPHPLDGEANLAAGTALLEAWGSGAVGRVTEVNAAADEKAADNDDASGRPTPQEVCILHLLRALVLDTRGAEEPLARAVACLALPPRARRSVEAVLVARGLRDTPRWRAACARADHRPDEALSALAEGLRTDRTLAQDLAELTLSRRDARGLTALRHHGADGSVWRADLPDARAVETACTHLHGPRPSDGVPTRCDVEHLHRLATALDALRTVRSAAFEHWATELATHAAGGLLPPISAGEREDVAQDRDRESPAAWLERWQLLAARSGAPDLLERRSAPPRVALFGEFNAGKSTLLNAIVGESIAPVSILPATATLHVVRHAEEPYSVVHFVAGDTRVVTRRAVVDVLRELDGKDVARVETFLPQDLLREIEWVDTPGFNSPHPLHAQAAARALEECDVALFVLDGTQALKASERSILERAAELGTTLVVWLNKSDRLDAPSRDRVLDTVQRGLADMAIQPFLAPEFLSAKDGPVTPAVERLRAAVQQARQPIKEPALRRLLKAHLDRAIAGDVQASAARAEAVQQRSQHHQSLRTAMATLHGRLEDVAHEVATAMVQPLGDLLHTLASLDLAVRTDHPSASTARTLYFVHATEEALGPPLAAALRSASEGAGMDAHDVSALDLTEGCTVLLRGFARLWASKEGRGRVPSDRASADALPEPRAQARELADEAVRHLLRVLARHEQNLGDGTLGIGDGGTERERRALRAALRPMDRGAAGASAESAVG
jgi:small GTP-binding protein